MRQALCELAIVCEQKQTFGVCVETADVEQPREFCRQQIENSIARVWISPGGNESCRLVQHDGELQGDVNKFAVNLDVVARAGLRAEVSAGFTVDSNPARRDQFITMPARSKARCGEETI